MAVSRALRVQAHVVRRQYIVATAAVGEYRRVKLVAEGTVTMCGANELGIGTAEMSGNVGDKVVVMLDGSGIVPMKCGTGGCTLGKLQKSTADGVTDVTIATGTVPTMVFGIAMQTGVVGDYVGVMIGIPTPTLNA